MSVLYRVTVKKKVSPRLIEGMWVEIILPNRPIMQKDMMDAFNAKYGKLTALGTIPRNFLEIVKM